MDGNTELCPEQLAQSLIVDLSVERGSILDWTNASPASTLVITTGRRRAPARLDNDRSSSFVRFRMGAINSALDPPPIGPSHQEKRVNTIFRSLNKEGLQYRSISVSVATQIPPIKLLFWPITAKSVKIQKNLEGETS